MSVNEASYLTRIISEGIGLPVDVLEGFLSPAGKAEYERLHPAVEAVAQALLGGLSPAQQRQFAAISDKVIAAMTQWIREHHEGVKV